MSRRLVRLEPPYLASILLVLLLWQASSLAPNFAGAEPAWTFAQVASHIAYAIPITEHSWLQPVYWTLAYEFLFYITVGIFYGFTNQPGSKVWLAVVFLVLCLSVAELPPSRCLLFLMGISVFRSIYLGEKLIYSLLLLSAAALTMSLNGASLEAGVGVVTACIIWLSTRTRPTRDFWRPLTALGVISYSLYLTHVPVGGRVVNLLTRYMPDNVVFDLVVSVVALFISVIFASVFYRFCERPVIEWAKTHCAIKAV